MTVAEDTVTTAEPSVNDKIVCKIDGELVHSVEIHIKNNHANTWTVERYKEEFPGEPLLSNYAQALIDKKRQALAKKPAEQPRQAAPQAAPQNNGNYEMAFTTELTAGTGKMHEIFDLGNVPAAMSAKGTPINVDTFSGHSGLALDYLPEVDDRHVFNIDLLKRAVVGFQLNIPIYFWGYHGTGKTTTFEQVSARTGRPFVRVQHTLNMQESEILGQWVVINGQTEFQLGPLPMAMIHGMTFCADEYDVAMPNVTTLYQPVLEGKALIIKDAPPHLRRIVPHKEFRFCATGNTNGCGDETGLYQGTLIQNAANYSRFGITEEVKYMERKIEESIIMSRTGVNRQIAGKIVTFAHNVRESFGRGDISLTVSPRELIRAVELASAFGGKWEVGLQLAFANRLPRADKEVVNGFMQRLFGSAS